MKLQEHETDSLYSNDMAYQMENYMLCNETNEGPVYKQLECACITWEHLELIGFYISWPYKN